MFKEVPDDYVAIFFIESTLLEGEATFIGGEIEFFLSDKLCLQFLQSLHMT